MARNKKYILIPDMTVEEAGIDDLKVSKKNQMYRLKALRDIPEHGVKAGDLGGLVTNKSAVSKSGSSWVAFNAKVFGCVFIEEDAYVGGNAQLINYHKIYFLGLKGNAKVIDNALVKLTKANRSSLRIMNDCIIADDAQVINVNNIWGNSLIYGKAILDGCANIYGTTEIHGEAHLKNNVQVDSSEIYGHSIMEDGAWAKTSKIYGEAIVQQGAEIISSSVFNKAIIGKAEKITNLICDKDNLYSAPEAKRRQEFLAGDRLKQVDQISKTDEKEELEVVELSEDAQDTLDLFEEIKTKIHAYESDIVKLIKYPAMADRTEPLTREMVICLNLASRFSVKPESEKFMNAVKSLEAAFLEAESNALKISSSALSEADLKKTERAKALLAIASNEGSAENEKRISFKQAFKQLEGVIVVPEIAIDTFRIKVGLKELES